ncbi:hypothetical protein SAMN02799631_01045 [Methylobacterium sp. 174MFSha1.1]|nr:hypothetical protein SAMN02799631_01045 [Methylobacterium sp. 174MFSha1.1]
MCEPLMIGASAQRQVRLRASLQRVADALGVSPETLIEDAKKGTFSDETSELLRLWFQIKDPSKRRFLLGEVRKAAGNAS